MISKEDVSPIDQLRKRYSIGIPETLVAIIDRDNPDDPIARQFVPTPNELEIASDDLDDPIGDEKHSPIRGLVHRHPDRVLLLPTLSCPVYCRYCFRRNHVGRSNNAPTQGELNSAINYIENTPVIREVILTGGDPFSLSDARLAEILDRLSAIPHIQNLRIHTRFPIVRPDRVTNGLITALKTNLPVWLVLHTNHVNELSTDVAAACTRFTNSGIPLLSQSVLLKGVNDDVEVLAELMRALIRLKVKPYYLHHPDRAQGTSHFRLTIKEGTAIVSALRRRISGLCQPTYVVDIPGGYGKILVDKVTQKTNDGNWVLEGLDGNEYTYGD